MAVEDFSAWANGVPRLGYVVSKVLLVCVVVDLLAADGVALRSVRLGTGGVIAASDCVRFCCPSP